MPAAEWGRHRAGFARAGADSAGACWTRARRASASSCSARSRRARPGNYLSREDVRAILQLGTAGLFPEAEDEEGGDLGGDGGAGESGEDEELHLLPSWVVAEARRVRGRARPVVRDDRR